MTDFLFLGSDVSLFRGSIRHYIFELKQHLSDDVICPSLKNKLDDLNELLTSCFRDGCFNFPYEYVDVVLDALHHYDLNCINKMELDFGYFELHERLVTLIAQINLMLECNDDD